MSQTNKKSLLDLLSQEIQKEIDHWIKKYPEEQKQSAVMAALRIVQDANGGYLTDELMDVVAEYLRDKQVARIDKLNTPMLKNVAGNPGIAGYPKSS